MQSDFPPTLTFPSFLHISPSFFVNLPILLVILAIFFVLYVIVSSVLIYHWNAYGMRSHKILIAEVLFLGVSVFLFFTASMALYYF